MSTGAWAAWGEGQCPQSPQGIGQGVLAQPPCGHAHLPSSLHRAQEVKEEPFFKGLDWQMVFLQKVSGVCRWLGTGTRTRVWAVTPLTPIAAHSTHRPSSHPAAR